MAALPSLTHPLLVIASYLPLLSIYIRRRWRRTPLLTVPDELPPPASPAKGGDLAGFGEVIVEEKRRKKKKADVRMGLDGGEEDGFGRGGEGKYGKVGGGCVRCCPYPFSSSASPTQRKIKLQYDQLAMSNQANALTITQSIYVRVEDGKCFLMIDLRKGASQGWIAIDK